MKLSLLAGVLQSTVLSPIFFNIFSHDIPTDPKLTTVLYADNITLIFNIYHNSRPGTTSEDSVSTEKIISNVFHEKYHETPSKLPDNWLGKLRTKLGQIRYKNEITIFVFDLLVSGICFICHWIYTFWVLFCRLMLWLCVFSYIFLN